MEIMGIKVREKIYRGQIIVKITVMFLEHIGNEIVN